MSDKPSIALPSGPKPGTLTRAPDFRTLFANQSRIRVAPGEVVMTFAIADDVHNFGTILTELVGIALTPTHAKTLAFILTETLKLYEETYGAIPQSSTTPLDPKKFGEIIKKAAQFDIQK
jgi:hypothetical protein